MTVAALPRSWTVKHLPGRHNQQDHAGVHAHGGAHDPRGHSEFTNPEWHGKVVAHHDAWVAANAPYENKTTEEWLAEEQAHVERLVANAGVYIRVRPSSLGAILDEGEVQTLFDGHSSGSMGAGTAKYKKMRGEFEDDVFAVSPKAKGYDHPTYGYLSNPGEHRNPGLLDDYGEVAVKLRPEVHGRTTFTGGDSMDHGGWGQDRPNMSPVLLTSPTPYAFQGDRSPLATQSISGRKYQIYTEAQVHGRVKVTDIERVHFPKGTLPDPELAKRLRDAGVEFEVDG